MPAAVRYSLTRARAWWMSCMRAGMYIAAVGGGRGQVRMAFQGEHLSHHVVVLDPAGGQRLLPCGERAAQPFAVADRVHRHR